jgi:hypothetical protein
VQIPRGYSNGLYLLEESLPRTACLPSRSSSQNAHFTIYLIFIPAVDKHNSNGLSWRLRQTESACCNGPDQKRRGKALVRPNTDPSCTEKLRSAGVSVTPVDSEVQALIPGLTGAICVVSTLQGLKDVIHTVQGKLLEAAVAAKVPRFIPSDFSLDLTKTKPGSNRNLDLRREFHAQLEGSGIAWTSILNGASWICWVATHR